MNTVMTTTSPRPPRAGSPEDGVSVRLLEPADSAAVLAVFAGMSARSRLLRFLVAKPQLTAADVRRLVAVDRRDHVAVLATTVPDHQPVGIARFVRDGDDLESAELAVEVADAWQRRGVGTMLVTALVPRAIDVGVRRLSAIVAADNEAASRLLRRVAGDVTCLRADRGVAEYVVSLDGVRR